MGSGTGAGSGTGRGVGDGGGVGYGDGRGVGYGRGVGDRWQLPDGLVDEIAVRVGFGVGEGPRDVGFGDQLELEGSLHCRRIHGLIIPLRCQVAQ